MATLEKAIMIATRAHEGQKDKAGNPYILHPLRVMLGMKTTKGMMAAVLHDVVEDTDVTLDDLREHGFPEVVVEAVDRVTKRKGESKLEAARRTIGSSLAIAVKLSDLKDNMDMSRLPRVTDRDIERQMLYMEVRAFLTSHVTDVVRIW